MNRLRPTMLSSVTLMLLIAIVGTKTASAARWRRRSNRVAPASLVATVENAAQAGNQGPSLLQKLHADRVATAQLQYDYFKSSYVGGKAGTSQVLKAQAQLFQAMFEAATTPDARLYALENSVKVALTDYELAVQRKEFAAASDLDVASAKYALLTAEIRLVEEKERQAAGR